MTLYFAIGREWSMLWFSLIHEEVDLGDPDCIETLYEMTTHFIHLALRHPNRWGPDTLPQVATDVMEIYGSLDFPIGIFLSEWKSLLGLLEWVLLPYYTAQDLWVDDLTPVIDTMGRLSGVCLHINNLS